MRRRLTIPAVLLFCAGCTGPTEPGESATSQLSLPEPSAYTSKTDFLRARVEHYTTAWIEKNPDKPYHYTAAVPIVEIADGVWRMETGPAVVSGPGLFVTVDESGDLIEIKEIFNPD